MKLVAMLTRSSTSKDKCVATAPKARKGEAVYRDQSPQALPVRPSWKNMPMMAIMAKRPLASSALNFFDFSAGSFDVRTFQPYSPGVPFLCGCVSEAR